jgi:NAD(P)-dependent dehydrogenase (short-subunit alcohol dehydrogenase family)
MASRVVIVTGAKGGLGNFVTDKFLKAGDTVIGASRSIQASDFSNPNFVAVPTDFAHFDSVRNLADGVVQRFGRIDTLVHVIGGFAAGPPLHETDDKTWSQMQDQNLTAAFYITRAVIPHLRKAGTGRFIAVGSKAADQPHANLGPYVIFKTALITLVKTVAVENADLGINVNAVLPGTMDTPTNRKAMPGADPKKWVNPAEVANLIFWLAGDEASRITGAAIPVSAPEV